MKRVSAAKDDAEKGFYGKLDVASPRKADPGVLTPLQPSGETPSHAPPTRLSIDRSSRYYDACYRRVDVYLDGEKRPLDVREYSVPEGYIMTLSGEILRGRVEPRWRALPVEQLPPPPPPPEAQKVALEAAEAKRARKAAKLAGRSL